MRASRLLLLAGGGPGYQPESNILFAAMTTKPDPARKKVINDCIRSLKDAGVWASLDCLWVPAAHHSQAATLNWISPSTFTLSPQSSPDFTVDEGYQGNGSSSYVNTTFVPSTANGKFLLDSACFGVYSLTDADDTAMTDMGAANSTSNRVQLISSIATSAVLARLNQDVNGTARAITNSIGHICATRGDNATVEYYRAGASLGTSAAASTGRPTVSVYLCATNNNGTAQGFSSRRIAAAHIGGHLNSTKVAAFNTALTTYMMAIGAV